MFSILPGAIVYNYFERKRTVVMIHSRETEEWSFLKESNVEIPVVLFDKCGVICFLENILRRHPLSN